jgi:O-antigen ligase
MCVIAVLGAWKVLIAKSVPGRVIAIVLVMSLILVLFGYFLFTGHSPFSALTDAVYAATGKEQTLTGRLQLWQLMLAEIDRHPWKGVGYGGFWAGPGGPSSGVAARLNWGPPGQAHSGYIDVINEVGYVGFALLVLLLLNHAAKVLTAYRAGETKFAIFHTAILLAALVTNYAESSLLRTTHIWWIVLCTSMVEVHCRLAVLQLRPPSQRSGTPLGYPQPLNT